MLVAFIINSTLYGMDLSDSSRLRVPVGSQDTYGRMIEEAASIREGTDKTQILTDKWSLLKRLFERPGPLVVDASMEAFIFEIVDYYTHNATGTGGLGFLAGETFGAYPKDSKMRFAGCMPLYEYCKDPNGNWHKINWDDEKAVTPILYKGKPLRIPIKFFDDKIKEKRDYEIQVYLINRDGTPVFGIRCPEILKVLYPEGMDERDKMRQFGLFGTALIETFKKIYEIYGEKGKVSLLRLNEPQLAIAEVARQNDIARLEKSIWKDTKLFVTTHTPNPAAFPHPSTSDLKRWIGDDLVPSSYENFDFGKYLASRADKINAVSAENAAVANRRVFPERGDVIGIQNGNDPKIWKSPELLNLEQEVGKASVTGQNLFEIKKIWKENFNQYIGSEFGIQFDDTSKQTFGLVRRLVAYKEQGILIAMIEWICGNPEEEYDTPWYGPGEKRKGLDMNLFIGGVGRDEEGRTWARIFKDIQQKEHLKGKFIFIESTGASLMKNAVRGCDLWANMPWSTEEASGTSGGRSSLNGTLNIATLTGEGLVLIKEGETGWPIDPFRGEPLNEIIDAIARRDPVWIERFKVGAQRDIGKALIEARDLYYNNPDELKRRMKNTYDVANETVNINVMVAEYIKEYEKLLYGTNQIASDPLVLKRNPSDTNL